MMDAKIAVLNSRLGNHTIPRVSPRERAMLLKDVHQQELGQLPEIRLPVEKGPAPCAVRCNGGVLSNGFHHQLKPDYVLHINKNSGNIPRKGLIDIREESFDSDGSSSPKPSKREDDCKNAEEDRRMKDVPSNAAGTADSSSKLLPGREKQASLSLGSCRGVNNCSQTQLLKLDTPLTSRKPHRPYLKSHSHREFSFERKENAFPDLSKNGSKWDKPLKTRSSSVASVLNKLPSMFTTCKSSSSQPNLAHSAPSSSSSSSSSLQPTTSYSPTQVRKQRVREMWRRAGEKLGLRVEGEDDSWSPKNGSWARGPGDVIRPNYSRWLERRHALAEPERMCMKQEVRERIQKEIESRRRSLKRRVSQFLTVKLGLDLEEDLAA